MDQQTKTAYVREVMFQKEMLKHLRKWLRNLMILSSISLVLMIFGQNNSSLLKYSGFVLMALSLSGCAVVGLGIRNGQNNIQKIIDYINRSISI